MAKIAPIHFQPTIDPFLGFEKPSYNNSTEIKNLPPGSYLVVCDCGEQYELNFNGGELDCQICKNCDLEFELVIETIVFHATKR